MYGEAPHRRFAQFVPPPWGLKQGTPGWVWTKTDVICTKRGVWAALSVILLYHVISYQVRWWTGRYLMLLLQDFIYFSIDYDKLKHIARKQRISFPTNGGVAVEWPLSIEQMTLPHLKRLQLQIQQQ